MTTISPCPETFKITVFAAAFIHKNAFMTNDLNKPLWEINKLQPMLPQSL